MGAIKSVNKGHGRLVACPFGCETTCAYRFPSRCQTNDWKQCSKPPSKLLIHCSVLHLIPLPPLVYLETDQMAKGGSYHNPERQVSYIIRRQFVHRQHHAHGRGPVRVLAAEQVWPCDGQRHADGEVSGPTPPCTQKHLYRCHVSCTITCLSLSLQEKGGGTARRPVRADCDCRSVPGGGYGH